jgi:hypothetical protein
MKMRPILFSTEMVKAIIDGRKTQTRRVVKPQPVRHSANHWAWKDRVVFIGAGTTEPCRDLMASEATYSVGDILWVRETWMPYFAASILPTNKYIHKATQPEGNLLAAKIVGLKWRPSIHMPREAARLFLRVTGVRCERLQELSPADYAAEGIGDHQVGDNFNSGVFSGVWDSINTKGGHNWDANPWVWVYEFERVDEMGVKI